MEVVAWIGTTVIVVVTDDSNVTLDSILPKVQGLDPTWAHSRPTSTSCFPLPPLYICFLVPPCFFHSLRLFQDGRTLLPTKPRTEVVTASSSSATAALLPDVPRAAANLVLAVLCIHCSNYIICGFNFESIFWSFYSNSMVHSHCRSPQPEYALPSMAIVVIAEIIPINLCLKRN